MIETRGYAAFDPHSPLRSHAFTRREPGPRDVQIGSSSAASATPISHQVRDEWSSQFSRWCRAHEIVGRVEHVGERGDEVSSAGERVGVGYMVGSCGILRDLPARRAAVLREANHLDLQQRRSRRLAHAGRLLDAGGGRQIVLCSACPESIPPGRRRAAALRRHHDVQPAAPLEDRRRPPRRHRRFGRPRTHGREAGSRAGGGGDADRHLAEEAGRRRATGRARVSLEQRCGGDDGGRRRSGSISSSTPSRRPAMSTPCSPACGSTARWCWSACRPSRSLCRRVLADQQAV